MSMNFNTQVSHELMNLTSQLPRVEASLTNQVLKSFKTFQSEMLAQVAKYDVTGVAASSYQKKRSLALIQSVKDLTKTSFSDISKETESELVSVANTTQGAMIKTVNGVAQVELMTHVLDSAQLRYLVRNTAIDGATSAKWWSAQSDALMFKFGNQIQDSMIKGDGVDVIVRKIRGTKAMNFNDGFMNTAFRHARSLVQASVQNVANSARLETMKANDDVIDGFQWLSTFDGHTTPTCRALDGLIWTLDYKPKGHSQAWPGATAHWGCRSTQVPVIMAFKNLPPSIKKKFEGSRASMDGQVSESVNYDEWLRKKNKSDPSFVEQTLGKEKYKIWKDKKLTMAEMVDQFNNPLTAEQLAKKFN